MNSDFYLALKLVEYKPLQYKKIYSTLEANAKELFNIVKDHVLNNPETTKQFTIATFNQVVDEEKRIIDVLSWFDKTYTVDTLNYYEESRYYLTEILNLISDIKIYLTEYLIVYKPETFTSVNSDLLKDILPPWNPYYPKENVESNNKPELDFRQIALIYVYKGELITKDNCKSIAQKYGHEVNGKKSGLKLYQYYLEYSHRHNRIALPGESDRTKEKAENKLRLLESIYSHLETSEQITLKADIEKLEKLFIEEYL